MLKKSVPLLNFLLREKMAQARCEYLSHKWPSFQSCYLNHYIFLNIFHAFDNLDVSLAQWISFTDLQKISIILCIKIINHYI